MSRASSAASITPSRARANSHYCVGARSRPEDDGSCNGSPPGVKPKSAASEAKSRRSLVLKRAKSGREETAASASQRSRSVTSPAPVEQFAPPRRPVSRTSDEDEKREKVEELEEKLVANESLIKDLQAQVVNLKAELEEARISKAELELKNQKLSQDVASAEAKVSALACCEKSVGEEQGPRFKDIQRLIASKPEQSKLHREAVVDSSSSKARSPLPPPLPFPKFLVRQVGNSDKTDKTSLPVAPPTPPPPPPPPPPPRPLGKAARPQKSPPVVKLYELLKKQDATRDVSPSVTPNKPRVSSVHSSIVGEIQNRSAHLLAIKMDIETKGDFINGLIQKVLTARFANMEDVLKFVDWLDDDLASLADERAVLKHFKWPERKADALREAAVEYRDLRKLENELSSYSDDPSIQYGVALKKMASLLDKSEKSIQRLIRLRSSSMRSYQEFKIPVEWMLDSGMISKIKGASMKLAKTYMKRVRMELEARRNLERESTQEALLLEGVRFAYRTHQFAGGLDSETLCALEEIKERVPGYLGLPREMFAGIPS